jgi:hypothetical protein
MRRLESASVGGPLGPYAAGFAEWLISQGYALSTVGHQLGMVDWLSRWLAGEGIAADALSEVVALRFRAGCTGIGSVSTD